jgi:imidazolonepropionase-like amidohydrolase
VSQTIAVLHGTLIDGTGAAPLADSAVIIDGGRVQAVGRSDRISVPEGAMVIEAAGKTVLPGIIEGHAHVSGAPTSVRTLRLSLQRGITTICSVSANITGIALRDAIAAGAVRGCARLVAGCIVTPTNGHVKFRTADGPWEVRKAVREMVQAGADFIKTAASGGFYGQNERCADPNYTYEELVALTEEAHAWGRPIACHVHTQPGLDNCIRAGVDMIHHGAFIDAAAVRGIKERDLFYIPTLAVTCQRNIVAKADRPWETKEMQEAQPIHRAGVRLAHELGVKIGVGCDYPGTRVTWEIGDRTMFELQELVSCGLSPMEAIVAGTRTTAAAFGKLDDFGTLEPGKRADLLVVSGDPAADIGVLYERENINVVVKDGSVEHTDDAHKRYYRVADE